jgi:hypothetical protein
MAELVKVGTALLLQVSTLDEGISRVFVGTVVF